METVSAAITGSFDIHGPDLYLINIFIKSRKTEGCAYVMFRLAFYCFSFTGEDLDL